MRVVLDLQQVQHVERGQTACADAVTILDLTRLLAKSAQGHDVIALLNGAMSEGLHSLQQQLRQYLPVHAIVLWFPPIARAEDAGELAAAALIRAAVIRAQAPDIVVNGSALVGVPTWPPCWPEPPTLPWAVLGASLDTQDHTDGETVWASLTQRLSLHHPMPPIGAQRLSLAYLGALPREENAGAETTTSVVCALSRSYDVTLFTAEVNGLGACLPADIKRLPVSAFPARAQSFDRILHRIGPSPQDKITAQLLADHPGVVLLDDTALGNLTAEMAGDAHQAAFFEAEGWPASICLAERGVQEVARLYDCLAPLLREQLGAIAPSAAGLEKVRAASDIPAWQTPGRMSAFYQSAIEAAYHEPSARMASEALLSRLAASQAPTEALARAVAASMPLRGIRRLLVDVTVVSRRDHGTGIQRVVREIARRLLARRIPGWRVEAMRGHTTGLVLAREWTAGLLNLPCPAIDELAEAGAGDRILLLDFPGMIEDVDMLALQEAQARGAELVLVLYDLLPVLHPEWFPSGANAVIAMYQRHLLRFVDSVICISKSVATELQEALDASVLTRARALEIGWFHLGSDFRPDIAGVAPPDSVRVALAAMARMPSLLMVGTVEPRKGHAQAIAAFAQLWAAGRDVALIVAGNQGWMTEVLCAELAEHSEAGARLHWLRHPSDADLSALYRACTGLLAASLGEGFGLPLVEASRIGKPILARDIPVFREVTDGHAVWFAGDDAACLATAIEDFFAAEQAGTLPCSQNIRALNWDESADQLYDVVMGEEWPVRWEQGHPEQAYAEDGRVEALRDDAEPLPVLSK
jgi:glycosyltransferase involved in cell wall biosynthesis